MAKPKSASPAGFKVQSKLCTTCIYRKSSPLDLRRLESEVADKYGGFKGYRACHHGVGNQTCCRGFWNRHKDQFALGQVAQRLSMVVFVREDSLAKHNKERKAK